jgi:hypothetical protein
MPLNVSRQKWDAVQSNGWTTRFNLEQSEQHDSDGHATGKDDLVGSGIGTNPHVADVLSGTGTGELSNSAFFLK